MLFHEYLSSSQILKRTFFWSAWIIIPVLFEIIPLFYQLIKIRFKQETKENKLEFYPRISLIIPVHNSEKLYII